MFSDEDIGICYLSDLLHGVRSARNASMFSDGLRRQWFRVFDPDAKPVRDGSKPRRKPRTQAQIDLSAFLAVKRRERGNTTRKRWVRDGKCIDCGLDRAPQSKTRCLTHLLAGRAAAQKRWKRKKLAKAA